MKVEGPDTEMVLVVILYGQTARSRVVITV
jgi:hypothetical protein